MTTGPEATLEKHCVRIARAAGGELIKLAPAHVRGLPDRLLIMPGGAPTFVEFKSARGLLSPMQAWWADRLFELGQAYAIVDTVEAFEQLLSNNA
jgi:hypothetical protein